MQKLVQRNTDGTFCVHGAEITTCNAAMYACVWKLMDYEATELSPDDIEIVKQMYDDSTQCEPIYRVPIEALIELSNKKKREIFLNKWNTWPVFARVPALNLEVRRIDFPDGTCFTASIFHVGMRQAHPRFQIHKGGIFTYNAYFETGTSNLVDKLMRMRMDILDKGAK